MTLFYRLTVIVAGLMMTAVFQTGIYFSAQAAFLQVVPPVPPVPSATQDITQIIGLIIAFVTLLTAFTSIIALIVNMRSTIETLKKEVEDLCNEFKELRKDSMELALLKQAFQQLKEQSNRNR